MNNPIPFNEELLTVKQMKEVADTVRHLFVCMDNGASAERIAFWLRQKREYWNQSWNNDDS